MTFACDFPLSQGYASVFHPSNTATPVWKSTYIQSPYGTHQWKARRWVFAVGISPTGGVAGQLTVTPDAADPYNLEVQRAFLENKTITIRLKFGTGTPADLTVQLKPQ